MKKSKTKKVTLPPIPDILKSLKSRHFQIFQLPIMAVAGVLLIGFFINKFIVDPSQTHHNNLKRELIKIDKKTKTYNRFLKKQSKSAQLGTPQSDLLNHVHKNTEDYVTDINNIFISKQKNKKLSFTSIKYTHNIRLASNEKKHQRSIKFSKSELELTILGRYQDLGKYVEAISKSPFIFSFYELSIKEHDNSLLQLKIKLHFYFISS